jgi:hypothetical protein
MSDQLDYDLLPAHLKEGMRRYVENGIETGSFLRAVLENDLEQAALRADTLCLLHLKEIALFLHSLPFEVWGSRLIVQAWIDKHTAGLA